MTWEEVEVNAAIAAMQANLANPELLQVVTGSELIEGPCHERVAKLSVKYAKALVEELKNDGVSLERRLRGPG